MNITGNFKARGGSDFNIVAWTEGAFTETLLKNSGTDAARNDSGQKNWMSIGFNASRTWTGEKLFCSNYFVD